MRVVFLILTVSGLLFGAYTRDDVTQTVYDDQTGLTWQDEPYTAAEADAYYDSSEEGKVLQWANAINYCENLELPTGVDNWRLPNYNELYILADRSRYDPAMYMDSVDGIDNGNGFENVTLDFYWSSTTYASDSTSAWGVYFEDGDDFWYSKTRSRYVRCVRSGRIVH